MAKKLWKYAGMIIFGAGFACLSSACPADSILLALAGDTKIASENNNHKTIDSLHAVVKGFRAQQNKKSLQLRKKIDEELSKPQSDKKIIGSYIKEQSELRMSIEKKWVEELYIVKSMVKPDSFTKYIKDNWGCNCGDADCSCVQKKPADSTLITQTALQTIVGSEKKIKMIDSLQTVIAQYRLEQGNVIRDLRTKIDEELNNPSTNEKLIEQYIVKQTELRTDIETKWVEMLYKVKALTKQDQFIVAVNANWGCKSAEADCGCVKKEVK
jgi:hypothetical protein